MADSAHTHVIAVQDHGTAREQWHVWTNPWIRDEAEAKARDLLDDNPEPEADDPEADHDTPAWSGIWLTRCSEPCRWAAPPPSLNWQLPPPGDPWWHAPGITPTRPHPAHNVTLMTIQSAADADLELLRQAEADFLADLDQMKLSDTELGMVTPEPDDE